jgi:hypothetical protein
VYAREFADALFQEEELQVGVSEQEALPPQVKE